MDSTLEDIESLGVPRQIIGKLLEIQSGSAAHELLLTNCNVQSVGPPCSPCILSTNA